MVFLLSRHCSVTFPYPYGFLIKMLINCLMKQIRSLIGRADLCCTCVWFQPC